MSCDRAPQRAPSEDARGEGGATSLGFHRTFPGPALLKAAHGVNQRGTTRRPGSARNPRGAGCPARTVHLQDRYAPSHRGGGAVGQNSELSRFFREHPHLFGDANERLAYLHSLADQPSASAAGGSKHVVVPPHGKRPLNCPRGRGCNDACRAYPTDAGVQCNTHERLRGCGEADRADLENLGASTASPTARDGTSNIQLSPGGRSDSQGSILTAPGFECSTKGDPRHRILLKQTSQATTTSPTTPSPDPVAEKESHSQSAAKTAAVGVLGGSEETQSGESDSDAVSDDPCDTAYRPNIHFLSIMSSQGTALKTYLCTVMAEVVGALHADKCSVFFVDDVRKSVCCVGSDDLPPFHMPWDKGIVGLAARGQLANVPDAHQHEMFDPAVEKQTGYVVKSLLAIPVKHMVMRKRTIGVIEVFNKRASADGCFSAQDAQRGQQIARLMSDSFYRHRWRAISSCGSYGDTEALSLLSHTSARRGSFAAPVSPKRASSKGRRSIGSVTGLFRWGNTPKYVGAVDTATLRSLSFSALDHSNDELCKLVEFVMEHSGCVEQCGVDPERLRSWIDAARHQYRDNPFHNWHHGFSVFQMCYYQLYVSNVASACTNLDVFGLLIAALCHDLDHPGTSNTFLVDSSSDVALRYNDMSVLENHHAFLACELLRRDETAIGAGLDKDQQVALRRTIIKCILNTDMAHHSELCQKIEACEGTEDKALMMSSCIHTADLSSQILPWTVAAKWEERISQEFAHQAACELAAGRTPAPFMHIKLDDSKQRGKLQRDFIDFVLLPLWDPYTNLVPALRDCYHQLVKNRSNYNYRAAHGEDPDPDESSS